MKKLFAFLLIGCILFSVTPIFAESPHLFKEAGFYTGTLYYCDAESGMVVLKNVAPMGTRNLKNTQTAQESNYSEIPLSGSIILPDASVIPMVDCNLYVDSNVRVLITRTAGNELRILNMKFL